MLQNRPPSPVTAALAKVLETLHPGAVARKVPADGEEYLVLSYRDPRDFNFLWDFWGEEVAREPEDQTNDSPPDGGIIRWAYSGDGVVGDSKSLIIVWDGVPDPSVVGNVYLGGYVTPYDWVMAFSLALRADGLPGRPHVRVKIIDILSGENTAPESARLYQQLQLGRSPLLDWVQVYRSGASHTAARGIGNLLADIVELNFGSAGAVTAPEPSSADGLDRRILRRIWGGRLLAPSDPRDRHAIANLVGPQLLVSAMTSWSATSLSADSPCLAALLTFMRVLGMFPHQLEKVSAPWVGPNKWKNYGLEGTDPVFVLLDDMHDLGWSEFLRLSLGVGTTEEKNGSLIVSGAPDAQRFGAQGASSLLDLLTDETGRLRVNGGIELYAGAKDAILFLDLRLFNQRTIGEEMGFFDNLLSLARQVEDNGGPREDLPWVGFSSQEIQAVGNCIAGQKIESDDYYVALTLLPRLIALVDPMLPVVLFSSTGQRRIAEALKGYGSIITDFDKPRFFGEVSGGIVEETRQRFDRAVTRALMLLKGRSVCRRFQTGIVPERNCEREYHAEIFIDEADEIAETTFRIGGVAIIYDDENQAELFNREMVRRGLTWGSTNIEPRPTNIINKRLPIERYQTTVYDPVEELLAATKVKGLIGFTLAAPPDLRWRDSTDLTSPWCLDNLYRNLVAQALETLFYEVLPEKLGQAKPRLSCGVYVANRKRCQSDADAPSDWDSANKMNITGRYGTRIKFDPKEKKSYFQSIASDSVYPLVAQVRALMPEAGIRVTAARGNHLRYGVDTEYPQDLPRPAHLLADPVVSLSNPPDRLKWQPSLKAWLARGFTSVADERFGTTLHSCRHARAGRYVEAILDAWRACHLSAGNNELEWWAKPRIAGSVGALSGRDFVELCMRLPAAIV